MLALQKLKAKQEEEKKNKEAAEKKDAPTNAPTKTDSGSNQGFVISKKPSSEVFEARKKKSQETVLSMRKKGAKKAGRQNNAALLRAQKDIAELSPAEGIVVTFPDPDDIMHFAVSILPNDGMYKGAKFHFKIEIPLSFPYDPPKATCETLIYHPNIDFEGHVCLNILRADWVPVLNIGAVLFGLMTLFLEPNPDDPLNKEAAKIMVEKPEEFKKNVYQSLRGGHVVGRQFPKLLNP